MRAWDCLVGILEPVAVVLLLIALGWAASERGRVHDHLAQLRRVSGVNATGGADRFSVFDRALRSGPDCTSLTGHNISRRVGRWQIVAGPRNGGRTQRRRPRSPALWGGIVATTATSPPVIAPRSTGRSSHEPRPERVAHDSGRDPVWHTLSVNDVIAHLATGLTGLASAEASRRLHLYGPNELQTLAQCPRGTPSRRSSRTS